MADLRPDTADAIHDDHRTFVGGDGPMWEGIGALQFDFLKSRGLLPSCRFVDVACGALRGGSHFIRYLDPGCYHGVDKHIELIIYGVAGEIGMELFRTKRPRFVVSDCFDFGGLGGDFAFAIAQSLFTHLNAADIFRCLTKLAKAAAPGCRLYATFFEAMAPLENQPQSHSHAGFAYTRQQMEMLGQMSGWRPVYIGDWNHPRNQKMMEFTLIQ
jgi:hypothetical protein